MNLEASIHDDPTSVYPGNGTFDESQDGLPSPGHLSLASPALLSGSVTGPNSRGYFTGSLSGSLSGLSISSVAELPDWFSGGDPCQDAEIAQLEALGLVGAGSSLAGSFSLTLSEFTLKGGPDFRGTFPRVEWTLDGVTDSFGGVWTLTGRNGNTRHNVFPVYEPGGTTDHLIVTVENSVVDFAGSSFSVTSCRADFTMTLTKASQP